MQQETASNKDVSQTRNENHVDLVNIMSSVLPGVRGSGVLVRSVTDFTVFEKKLLLIY